MSRHVPTSVVDIWLTTEKHARRSCNFNLEHPVIDFWRTVGKRARRYSAAVAAIKELPEFAALPKLVTLFAAIKVLPELEALPKSAKLS